MKRLPFVFFLFFGFVCTVMAENPVRLPADEFVDNLVLWFKPNELAITQREKEALRDSHRILLTVSDNHFLQRHFWEIVCNAPSKNIEWGKAKQLILEGKVVTVEQSHNQSVGLTAWDGCRYITKEPKIDDVYYIVKQVDPKSVFIYYITE